MIEIDETPKAPGRKPIADETRVLSGVVSAETHAEVCRRADEEGISRSAWLRRVVCEAVEDE